MKTALSLVALAVAIAPALSSAAPVTWAANGHSYELVTQPGAQSSYATAKAAAEASSFGGVQGHLLILETADYANELAFVRTSVILPNTPTTSYWVGATRAANAADVRTGWVWDDGTSIPTSITNGWNIDQNEGSASTTNYGAGFYSQDNYTTLWDYAQGAPLNFAGGYIVEYAAPVPEPATLAALGLGAFALLRRRRKS